MSTNFILDGSNLSVNTIINMTQNNVINLPLPNAGSDFANKKYVDEQIAVSANADKIIVDSDDSTPTKENVQQVLEKLQSQATGLLPLSGGTMNAS